MNRPRLRRLLVLLCAIYVGHLSECATVLPIKFQPLGPGQGDSLLYELYANTSLFGVFIAGLSFGTPPQALAVLIDTGSGITHLAPTGCSSTCGIGLTAADGFNHSASSTFQAVPCGDRCGCSTCECDTTGSETGECSYLLAYADGSASSGLLVSDHVTLAEGSAFNVRLEFGLEQRQTGLLQSMGMLGLLALDRSSTSFVGQLREQNLTHRVAFATCWELDFNGRELGSPDSLAHSYLLLGAPQQLLSSLEPQWAPLLPGSKWTAGLEAIEVLGPGGGVVDVELRLLSPSAAGSPSGAPSSGDPGVRSLVLPADVEAELGEMAQYGVPLVDYGLVVIDSGATYTRLPAAAYDKLQQLMLSAVAARGLAQVKSDRPSTTCWEGLASGTLTQNASQLLLAFPEVQFRFVGNASFTAPPIGYLVPPDRGGAQLVCLTFFPWQSSEVLLGSRIRQRVLTVHDDTRGHVGFAAADDCQELAGLWGQASDQGSNSA